MLSWRTDRPDDDREDKANAAVGLDMLYGALVLVRI